MEKVVTFNPKLSPWKQPQPNNVAGNGTIEIPGQTENMIWQTRKAEPTRFENDLGDALVNAFDAGAIELDQVVESLNEQGLRSQDGARWTMESFTQTMRKLAE